MLTYMYNVQPFSPEQLCRHGHLPPRYRSFGGQLQIYCQLFANSKLDETSNTLGLNFIISHNFEGVRAVLKDSDRSKHVKRDWAFEQVPPREITRNPKPESSPKPETRNLKALRARAV